MAPPTTLSIPLRGPAGEPVDFRRTALSHGLTSVVPFAVDEGGHALRAVVRLPERSPRVVELRSGSANACQVSVGGSSLDAGERRALETVLERMLALDTDLTAFYELSATDPLLSWAPAGAGRIVRSQTVFEDVIRTICTTNCAFSATRRMITAAVEELGEPAESYRSATDDGCAQHHGEVEPTQARAFPTPERVARAGLEFFRERARAGYRSASIVDIARRVADGELDLEALRPTAVLAQSDDEARARLLELPGIGPYAAAHAMMLTGRYSQPILDSWSRPAYEDATGENADDRTIQRRFERFGPFAGLAFWLVATRSWIE